MKFTQLQAYLKAYLETNDSAVIDQIPNFMTLALARISAELRGVVAEVSVDLLPEPTQPQPAGFMGAALLLHDGMVSEYVSPAAFAGLTNEPGAYYTLLAGQISAYPEPTSTTLMTLTYYQATGDNMSASLPHLLLHCAAAEAEMFQGNLQDAATEIQLYQNDMGSANGWDIQSGPITLGGGLRATQGAVGSPNTSGAGYVKGPAGATSGFIPLWDGTTGRLLASGLSPASFADKSYVDSQNAAQDAVIATKADTSALGTAAFATLTASATDSTAGRVLKVGDFGVGTTTSIAPPTITDLNLTTWPGGFYIATVGGTTGTKPVGADTNGVVLVERFSSGIIKQTYLGVLGGAPQSTQRMFFRYSYSAGNWNDWAEVATSANSIGQSQAWQDVTASRALNTIYTNTTGRPIQVKVSCITSAVSVMQLFVAGSATSLPAGGISQLPENSAIIPNGVTYRALNNAGTASSLSWWELR